jgi:hypothetical protein
MERLKRINADILFLAVILLVGLATVIPYGAFLDQSTEQIILFSNIKEYLMHIPGVHIGLIDDMTARGIENIQLSIDRYNGMAIYYPMFGIWYLNNVSPYLGNILWHTYIFMLVFWGICSLFLLTVELFKSSKTAAFVTLLFFLTPRMFAESHYNNKDMVLLSLSFVLLYWGRRIMNEASGKNIFMFAFTGALAANMKIIGVWIFGILGIYLLIYFMAAKQMNEKLIKKVAACIILWLVIYFIITPAAWGNPIDFIKFLISCATDFRWHDYILFGGNMYNKEYTGMPKGYLLTMMLITIPVGILLLFVAGVIASITDLIKSRGQCLKSTGYVLTALIICAVPLVYAVASGTPVYNGWRHFYFVYAAVILTAGYGANSIRILSAERGMKRKVNYIATVAGILYITVLAAGIAVNYPQEHSFYNVLAGRDVVHNYELDYWDMSVKQALEKVAKDSAEADITVGALNNPTAWGIEQNMTAIRGKYRMHLTFSDDWQEADYIIVNTTYAVMYSNDAYETVVANYERIQQITSYGNIVCEVYKRGNSYE